MTISVYWHDENKQIVRIEYSEMWSLDELYKISLKSHQMVGEVSHQVDILVDLRRSRVAPTQLLSSARYVNSLVQPNQGLIVTVGAPTFLKALIRVAGRIMPQVTAKLRYVNTLDEAFDTIQQYESKPS
ncbi:MAG: hypothetical protein H7Y09_00465 [Chitinophagaceae bacterium]|nr:hypothetical protein [Anaerolineae bacterium]